MAKTREVNRRANGPYRFNASNWKTKDQWRRWEMVGMAPTMALDDLLLNWADKKVLDLDIKRAIESITINRTIDGANTIEISLRDPKRLIFKESVGRSRRRIDDPNEPNPIDEGWNEINQVDVIGRAVSVELDGCSFRLVKVGWDSVNNQTTLTFEDRMIYWLRRKKGHSLRVSRNEVTRAQFILRLLRQVQVEKMPFICPELFERQAIAKIKSEKASPDPDTKGGFDGKANLTVKGVKATNEQRRNMATAFEAAESVKGCTDKILEALACTCTTESLVQNLPGGDQDSRGIIQVQDRTAAFAHVTNTNIASCVIGWMKKGYGRFGGAVEYSKKHPHARPGLIAAAVQYLETNVKLYSPWEAEAKKWVRAWNGSAGESASSADTSYVKSYQYARAKDEDSWTCIQRLAEEVGWKAFIVGRSFYFMSIEQLYQRRVRHLIKPGDGSYVSIQADMDWGKEVNTATLVVFADRWAAPPGSVIELDEEFDIIAGRWLVQSSSRDWFSPQITLTLIQPGGENREKPEPAPEIESSKTSESEVGGAGGKADQFWHYASLVNKNTTRYQWGGGHGKPFSQQTSSDNFDCSGSISYACFKAGMWPKGWPNTAVHSSKFEEWGEPGKGEKITIYGDGNHVYADFEEGAGHGSKRFDTSGGTPPGARIRSPRRGSTQGKKPRHWPGL
jgi:hypothetical protein